LSHNIIKCGGGPSIVELPGIETVTEITLNFRNAELQHANDAKVHETTCGNVPVMMTSTRTFSNMRFGRAK
jgi:hypothetical protein